MKKTLFLMTHPGSGWQKLAEALNKDPRIEIALNNLEYHHFNDVDYLTQQPHKSDNSLSIWGDVILHNHIFTCRTLLKSSYFIFWHSDFDPTHPEWSGYTDAETYYRLRVSGMIQYSRMAAKTIWNPVLGDLPFFFN